MRNTDITWKPTDNSEYNKQPEAISHGNLACPQSKTTAHCSLLIANSTPLLPFGPVRPVREVRG
jgi:hypothetical protein